MPLTEIDYNSLSKIQFPMGISNAENTYEMTITFDTKKHTIRDAYKWCNEEASELIIEWLTLGRRNTPKLNISSLHIVMEYQRNFYPHLHIAIASEDPIPSRVRSDIIKGMEREAGRTTFKSTIDVLAFEEYLQKDLRINYERSGIRHFRIFYNN
jgi:hypothetical protein